MSNKPVFVLPVDSLAGPGNRWMKIIPLLSEVKDFDFKIMMTNKLYQSIKNLDNLNSSEFIIKSECHLVLIYNYNYKILNVFEYFIKALILRLKGYDTIHSIMGLGFSLRLKKYLGYKINYEVVGPRFADALVKSKSIKKLSKIICVSESIANQIKLTEDQSIIKMIETYPVPFYYSVDNTYKGMNKENIIVFAHNYMVKRKNAIMCAFLFHELSRIKPDWKFYFLGKGDDGDDRYKIYIDYILSDSHNVTFDYYEDIIPTLQKSKIFLSLNSINNYPSQSILEAMDNCNALVVTNTGQSNQFIEGNGVLVDVEYYKVKKAILDLMNDLELVEKGNESRQLLKKRFDPSKFIKKLVEIYS